jgi:hypothetical protein
MRTMGVSRKKARYSGELAKPIDALPIVDLKGGRIADPESVAKSDERMLRQHDEALLRARLEKLQLLMDHHCVEDKTDYLSLAVALAIDHVPGFSVRWCEFRLSHDTWGAVEPVSRTGRRRDWTGERLSELLENVEETKRHWHIREDREALRILARKGWKPPANHRGDNNNWLETLESR